MAVADPSRLGVVAARQAIAEGRLTPRLLVEACLARIAAREDDVRAWVHVAADAAAGADAARGPLAGIPFGVKDIIDTADMPTAHGSPIYADHRPARDAGCVALLRAAGAIALGKTVTAEFAFRHPGPTRNPVNPAHTPGGSSSGSAAAVAEFMVPFALGTQTKGSVIRPAAFCGIVGYKPSFGEVTRSGVYDVSASVDTVGAFVRDARDLAAVRAALLGIDEAPVPPAPLADLQFALWADGAVERASDAASAAVEATADRLERAGAKRVELGVPEAFAGAARHHDDIVGFEFVRAAAFERTRYGERLSADLRDEVIAAGLAVNPPAYHAGLDALAELRRQFAQLAHGVDVVLAPSALGEAPRGLASTGDPACNALWTALHVPAVTLPAGQGPSGLPLGVQLIGHFRADARLLGIAEAVQATLAED